MSSQRPKSSLLSNIDVPRKTPSTLVRLVVILIIGVLLRLLLFDYVPVNYDAGYYLYDASQILSGKRPIVDFFSRSPLFHYIFASGLILGFSPLITGRIMMIFTAVVLAVSCYILGTRIHSHNAGIYAAALVMITPLSLVWGLWIKTEHLAALSAILAAAVYLPQQDSNILLRYPLTVGTLLGTGFLIRRTTIVYLGLFVMFGAVYRMRINRSTITTGLSESIAITGSFGITVLFGYLLLANFQVDVVARVFRAHFLSFLPILSPEGPNTANGVYNAGLFDFIFFFCQTCTDRTVSIVTQAILLLIPPIVLLYIYIVGLIKNQFERFEEPVANKYRFVGLVVIVLLSSTLIHDMSSLYFGLYITGIFAVGTSTFIWFLSRLGVKTSWIYQTMERNIRIESIVVLFFVLVWYTQLTSTLSSHGIPNSILIGILSLVSLISLLLFTQYLPRQRIAQGLNSEVVFVGGIGVALLMTYLARERVIFVGYFQEAFPFLAILAGATLAAVIENVDVRKVSKIILVSMIILIVVMPTGVGLYLAADHGGVQQPYNPDGPGTVSGILAAGEYIESTTQSDDKVLTVMPLYTLESDRQSEFTISRMYWWLSLYPDAERTQHLVTNIRNGMVSGDIKYVVVENRFQAVRQNHPELDEVFSQNYCLVEDAESVFTPLNAHLYDYCGDTQ